MIEEDTKIEPREHAPADQYGEALFYDLGKFLPTLCLLAIGGVLTIADSDRVHVKPAGIAIIAVVLSLAAIVAAAIPTGIAQARFKGEPVDTNLPRMLTISMALLGLGVGMFLYTWIAKLD
jgi:hypothetical protein